ncbi:hypothetical protein ACFL0V_03305 [Nanoarchaeota archaeon]
MTDEYFVQVKDPEEVRRMLLGSSKQIVQVLQRYETLKDIRVQKLEKLSLLRKLNKEIHLLLVKLKKEMPKADIRIKPKIQKESTVTGNEVAELEAELKRIEEKIGMIS